MQEQVRRESKLVNQNRLSLKKGHLSFSLLFWLNKSRSKNNKPAIYLRLRIGDKRAELSTYLHVSSSQWNPAGQCIRGNSEESQTINRQLAVLKANLHRHYSILVAVAKPFSVEDLKNAALGKVEH